ncbi:hypothetical protein RUM44_002450 [Polyplax serrata]|uniref:Uncharacterized protein n=1 Tax=Polyplax serrata TaxID=468196 RepID=A0ABR1AES9_POLSC
MQRKSENKMRSLLLRHLKFNFGRVALAYLASATPAENGNGKFGLGLCQMVQNIFGKTERLPDVETRLKFELKFHGGREEMKEVQDGDEKTKETKKKKKKKKIGRCGIIGKWSENK